MKPTVVIATHHRVEITINLINKLFTDYDKVNVIVVTSQLNEFHAFKKLEYENLHVVKYTNWPLGQKWQQGVNYAKKIGADPVIILGSDDELNPEFIPNALEYLKEYHFIGLKRYWVKHEGKRYLIDYKPVQPLGGGRVYSKRLLDSIGWKLFKNLDRKLDDFGWEQVVKSKARFLLVQNIEKVKMEITAVKGDWPMLNPFDPNHKNLSVIKCVE